MLAYPEVEPDIVLGVSLHGSRWQIRAQALAGIERTQQRGGASWTLRRWVADLAACFMPTIIGVCAGIQLGAFQVSVRDVMLSHDAETLDASGVLRAMLDTPLSGAWRYWASLDGVIQLVAHRVETFDGAARQELWSSPGLGVAAATGVGLRFE